MATDGTVSVQQTDVNNSAHTFTYSMHSGLGSVDAAGVFHATLFPGLSLVKALSSVGEIRYLTIDVTSGFVVLPAVANVGVGSTKQFVLQGNIATSLDYLWSTNLGTVTNQGVFSAPGTVGNATLTVQNSSGLTSTANIIVSAELGISPSSVQVSSGKSLSLSTSGGVGVIS